MSLLTGGQGGAPTFGHFANDRLRISGGSVSARLPEIRASQRGDRERSFPDRTARPLMPLERRRFMAAIAGGLLAAPLGAEAQQAGRVAHLGLLSVDVASFDDAGSNAFVAALRELGWIVGQNLVVEARYAAGQTDRLPALAAELVRLKVDLIMTVFNEETLAAQQATASIPIVMLRGIHPEQAGFVANLAHPGGNITGTTVGPVTGGKYLELLKEAVPKLRRVSIMLDPTFPGLTAVGQAQVEGEARRLGLTLTPIAAQRPDEVEPALTRVAKERPGALWVVPVGPLAARVRRIIAFATKERLPTI